MDSFHSLLRRQWQRHFGHADPASEEWRAFLQTVSTTYDDFDKARFLASRALELSSEELRATNAELHGVLRSLPDLLFRVRADGRVSSVLQDSAGAERPALRSLLEEQSASDPSTARQFWDAVQQVRQLHAPIDFEYSSGSSSEGSFFHVRLLPFVEGDIIGVIQDVTAEKRVVESRQLLDQERYQAQKMDSLGSLAGGVAHDFNNMLGGIMGYADLLLAEETDPRRRKYLQAIVLAATRSADLTQKLLAFGRRGKNLMESLKMRDLVQDCLEILRPSMSPDLQVIVDIDGSPTVDGDPSQIRQVLVNLCLNAMEAMPERGTLTISAKVRNLLEPKNPGLSLQPGAYLELVISDTGLGMTEEVQHRIFEPFFTTKQSIGITGTGLGLSTAYGIVQTHQGAITVDSARGKGSTFRIFLPVGTLSPVPREALAGPSRDHGMILLVEDEPMLRDMGTSILESLGYQVLPAADGLEAVAAFREHHQRLSAVLLDLKMPKMGGREAFAVFQGIDPSVPVVVCTGYGDNEEVQELLTMGAVAMLAKPFRIVDLAAKLQQVTSGSSGGGAT
jgi:signal transduction histidine kinase/ActR/RegA family two-component response regulator